jgi:hypothetical protein
MLLITAASVLWMQCEPEVEPVTIFTIAKGSHYSTPRAPQTLQSKTLRFTAVFDESARYDFGDVALQSSKNKLLGFADCNSTHRLEIFAYCYVNGERKESFIGTVPLNVPSRYEIMISDDEYIFTLNDEPPVRMERGAVCEKGVYYMLNPYFGGSVPAPHDIRIKIRFLY